MIQIETKTGAKAEIESLGGNSYEVTIKRNNKKIAYCPLAVYHRQRQSLVCYRIDINGHKDVLIAISESEIAELNAQLQAKIKNSYRPSFRMSLKDAIKKAAAINKLVRYNWNFTNNRSDKLADAMVGHYVSPKGQVISYKYCYSDLV